MGEYFELEDFEVNRTSDGLFRHKDKEEIRLLSIGVSSDLDSAVIGCMSGKYNAIGELIRSFDYITTVTMENLDKVEKILANYKPDYIVLNLRNGGQQLYEKLKHLTVYEDIKLVSDEMIQLLKSFKTGKEIPCVIPILGNITTNSDCHTELKKSLKNNKLKLLISDTETDLLIEQAENLTPKYNNGCVVLEGNKDRLEVLEYGNYVFSLFEKNL